MIAVLAGSERLSRHEIVFNLKALLLLGTFLTVLRPTQCMRSDAYQCDRSYVASVSSGIIAHYNYPFNYTSNLQCTTRFHIPYLHSSVSWFICFSFQRFQLTDSDLCSDDYLSFENEYKYCGSGKSSIPRTDVYSNVFNSPLCWPLTAGGTFNIEFSSRYSSTGLGYYANYSITDDLESEELCIRNNSCKAVQGACRSEEFRCFNGGCISSKLLCDGISQCQDGSDESYTHARCAGKQNISSCSFEEDTCQMKLFGWSRGQQSQSGPSVDNTFREFGKGSFLYAEFPVRDTPYANFTFTPPLLLSGSHRCLSFFYYMSGYVGKFAVRLRTRDGWKVAWIREGSQAVAWLQAEISLPPNVLPVYEISFQVVNNPAAINNIGLDDISVNEGLCFGDDLSCTFDVDLCGWRPHLSVPAQWSRKNGPTSTNFTGPTFDHTTQEFLSELEVKDGYYMYLKASDYPTGSTARLMSRSISHGYSGAICLMFWYHMHGAGMGTLKIYTSNSQGSISSVWDKTGDQRDAWHLATVSLTKINGPFYLIIEAVRGPSQLSDMAVDDIQLTPGYCTLTVEGPGVPRYTVPPAPGCLSSELKCTSGNTCFPKSGLCDGVIHCEDKSDEFRCPSNGWQIPDEAPGTDGTPQCSPGQLRCLRTYACFSRSQLCDGYPDCGDKSDETRCYRTGGPLLPHPEYIGFATSAVIGASIGGIIVVAAIITCIIIAVKWRSISACLAMSSAQRRSSARRRILHDSLDCGMNSSEGRHTLHSEHAMTAPPYVFEPPPYSPRDVSKPAGEPPTYEQYTDMPDHLKEDQPRNDQLLMLSQQSESEADC